MSSYFVLPIYSAFLLFLFSLLYCFFWIEPFFFILSLLVWDIDSSMFLGVIKMPISLS